MDDVVGHIDKLPLAAKRFSKHLAQQLVFKAPLIGDERKTSQFAVVRKHPHDHVEFRQVQQRPAESWAHQTR